jgi:hypothetical protein
MKNGGKLDSEAKKIKKYTDNHKIFKPEKFHMEKAYVY